MTSSHASGPVQTDPSETAQLHAGADIVRRPGRLAGKVDEAFFEPLPEAELQAWSPSSAGTD